MTKITKKNSILYNQLWINKAIEEGNLDYIPIGIHKYLYQSIGEYIEEQYQNRNATEEETSNQEMKKITKNNSILFTLEWMQQYKEKGLKIPTNYKYLQTNYSLGEILELKYLEMELSKQNPNAILYLPHEKIKKLSK